MSRTVPQLRALARCWRAFPSEKKMGQQSPWQQRQADSTAMPLPCPAKCQMLSSRCTSKGAAMKPLLKHTDPPSPTLLQSALYWACWIPLALLLAALDVRALMSGCVVKPPPDASKCWYWRPDPLLILSPGAQSLFCRLHRLILPTRAWKSPPLQGERPSCWPEGSVAATSLFERDWSPCFRSRPAARRSPARSGITHRTSSPSTSHWSLSGCSLADGQRLRSEAASQRSGFSETAGSCELEDLNEAYSAGSMVLAVTAAGACFAVSVTDAVCSAVSVTDAAEPPPAPVPTLQILLRLILPRSAVPAARAFGWTGSAAFYPEKCCGSVPRGAGAPRHDGLFHCGPTPAADPRKRDGGRENSRSLQCPPPGLTPSMLRHSTATRLVELGFAASAPVMLEVGQGPNVIAIVIRALSSMRSIGYPSTVLGAKGKEVF